MRRTSMRTLVADPCQTACRRMQLTLANAGFKVETVSTGEELLRRCESDPPDVLILDLELPDIDGFELCERVRHETRDQNLTIIITTDAIDDMTRGYLGPMVDYVGGDYFVAKPCDVKVLTSLLDDLSGAYRADVESLGHSSPTQPEKTPSQSGSQTQSQPPTSAKTNRRPSPTRAVWPTSRVRIPATTY